MSDNVETQNNTAENLESNNNQNNQGNNEDTGNNEDNNNEKKNTDYTVIGTYIFYGLCILAVFLLIYYAYGRFVENSISEPFTKGNSSERSDAAADYNLQEAIHKLESMQRNILRGLSGDTGF